MGSSSKEGSGDAARGAAPEAGPAGGPGRAIMARRRAAARGRRARSSAIRSSQPPTWVSPMKICGTVQRPVSLIIVARSPGRSSTRISSIARRRAGAAAPWPGCSTGRSRCCTSSPACIGFARAQAAFSTGRLAARQAARPPARTRAFSKPSFFSTATARGARAAGRADDHQRQRLVLRQLARGLERGERHVLARPTAWPAAYSAGSLTSISTRLLAVDQAAPRRRRDTRAAGRRPAAASARAAGRRRRAPRRRDTSSGERSSRAWRARDARWRQSANYRIPPLRPPRRHRLAACRLRTRSRSSHAQARPGSPRRIDLEPGEPLHRLDRRRRSPPPASSRRAQAGRLLKEDGYEFDRRLHLGAEARDLDALARARRDGPDLAAGDATTGG